MSLRRPEAGLVLLLTTGASLAGCVSDAHSRSQGTAAAPESVTLEELAAKLAPCVHVPPHPGLAPARGCVRVAYVWSPSMPLSEVGIEEIRAATGAMDLPLSVLRDTELLEPSDDPEAERLRGSLISTGATIHYPTLVILADGGARGTALAGFKRAAAYRGLLEERIAARAPSDAEAPSPRSERRPVSPTVPAQDVRVLWSYELSPAPGAFFRHVPGTTFISYDQQRRVYLHDLASGERFVGPGWIDFVPTPDGLLFVTPAPGSRGLEFYDAGDVFRGGLRDAAGRYDPVFTDAEMADQYPSVGILGEGGRGTLKTYRVLVSWYAGLAFRDYEVSRTETGSPAVVPVGPKRTACPELDLSTPILSKDGTEVAARDEATGTTKVFRLREDEACEELFDFGRATSKVGFNGDGSLIAYSSADPPIPGRVSESTTFVLDRGDMHTVPVPFSRSVGLVVPEMVGTDSVLISVKGDPRDDTAEFRLLCCVR